MKQPSKPESPGWRSTLGEHFAYGAGTLLIAAGPVLAGMEMITWMAIFMGINALALIAICLFGIWNSLHGNRSRARDRR